MKLLNQSLKYLSISIFLIVSVWSVIFYFNMLDEIYDSIDDGLTNYKMLIIHKAEADTNVLHKSTFDEGNYAIRELNKQLALRVTDVYQDTLIYTEYEKDLEPFRVLTTAFKRGDTFYQLKVISSMVEEDDLLEDLFWSIFWLYLILIISILIINNLVIQKLWKPFYTLLNQLKNFRIDQEEKLPDFTTNIREFKELKEATNALILHSTEAYQSQKQFTENAAHELQTPLAIATNKLELLLENETIENTHIENIAQVLQIIERLTRLNKSLLLLSKIENKQYFDNQDISINSITRQSISDLEDFSTFKDVTIELHEQETVEINIDPTLTNILLSNLIKNAIVHNIPEGKVRVFIQNNSIEIRNTGANIPLNKERIFNRFYKSSSENQHTGLGLAIVQAICKLYSYRVSYHFDGEHIFKIGLK